MHSRTPLFWRITRFRRFGGRRPALEHPSPEGTVAGCGSEDGRGPPLLLQSPMPSRLAPARDNPSTGGVSQVGGCETAARENQRVCCRQTVVGRAQRVASRRNRGTVTGPRLPADGPSHHDRTPKDRFAVRMARAGYGLGWPDSHTSSLQPIRHDASQWSRARRTRSGQRHRSHILAFVYSMASHPSAPRRARPPV